MILKNHWMSKEAKRNHQVHLVKDLIVLKKKLALRKLQTVYLDK